MVERFNGNNFFYFLKLEKFKFFGNFIKIQPNLIFQKFKFILGWLSLQFIRKLIKKTWFHFNYTNKKTSFCKTYNTNFFNT